MVQALRYFPTFKSGTVTSEPYVGLMRLISARSRQNSGRQRSQQNVHEMSRHHPQINSSRADRQLKEAHNQKALFSLVCPQVAIIM